MTTPSLIGLVTDLVTRLELGTLDVGFQRPLQRGSARGTVTVSADPEDRTNLLLIVRLEIMSAPKERVGEFCRALLELNHGFQGRAAFSLAEDGGVCLSAGRPLADLDPGEVVDLILWTSQQADHYDDLLLKTFPAS